MIGIDYPKMLWMVLGHYSDGRYLIFDFNPNPNPNTFWALFVRIVSIGIASR